MNAVESLQYILAPMVELELMMAEPPVESVGKAAAQIAEAHRTIAASSITRRERDSERPASEELGNLVLPL